MAPQANTRLHDPRFPFRAQSRHNASGSLVNGNSLSNPEPERDMRPCSQRIETRGSPLPAILPCGIERLTPPAPVSRQSGPNSTLTADVKIKRRLLPAAHRLAIATERALPTLNMRHTYNDFL
jgi:hypothetical protein